MGVGFRYLGECEPIFETVRVFEQGPRVKKNFIITKKVESSVPISLEECNIN
jgi:hypothetical protein